MSIYPIRYGTGEPIILADDLQTGGYGSNWGHTRNFQSRWDHNQTLGQGYSWQVDQWPYLVVESNGNVAVLGQSESSYWFLKMETSYVSRFGDPYRLELDTAAHRYCFYGLDGTVTEFDDFTGMFRKRISPGGEVIEVKAMAPNGYNFTVVERSETTNGVTTLEQFQYEYITTWADTLLQRVTLRRKVGTGDWFNVTRASYTYYGPSEAHGGLEDLKTAATETWTDSGWEATGTTLYRYYPEYANSSSSSSSSSGTGPGEPWQARAHLLKYVLFPAAYARMVADEHDPLTASDLLLSVYADHYFEYDSNRRVTKELVQGGSQTFLFSYVESLFDDGINAWKTKTTETLPDGSQNIVFCNFAAQPLLSVFQSNGDKWLSFTRYDDQYRPILEATPAAISDYDEDLPDLVGYDSLTGTYEYLREDAGLIITKTYHVPSGYLTEEAIQEGQLGAPVKLRTLEYCACGTDCGCGESSSSSSSGGDNGVWLTKREIVYPSDANQTLTQITSYCYAFHAGTCAIQERITTLPVVPTEQNGTGVADTRREVFDIYGNLTWTMDERGFITRMSYDIPTGAIAQRVEDVDTSLYTDAPAGWTTPSGGGLNLVTDFEHDRRGRITQSLGPMHSIDLGGTATNIRRATWTVYADSATGNELRIGQGYATGSSPSYDFTLINPVSITQNDLSGKLQAQLQATRDSTTGKLLPSDTFAQSSYTRWRTLQYTDCCTLASERVYHTIPSSGSSGTNYDQTDYGYDVRKRRNRTVTPGGTITRTVIDPRGLVTSTWIGTNDNGGTATDPSGGGASGNNMRIVSASEYDGGQDGGNGYLTEQTQYATASDTRITIFTYDYRGRRLTTDGEIDFFQQDFYDNLNRVVQTDRFDTTINGNLVTRSETRYDARGRAYQRVRYGVDPGTGTVGNSLTDNSWYDPSGRVLCSLPAGSILFTKLEYDSLGRTIKQFTGYNPGADGAYPLGNGAPDNVEDDVLLEQAGTLYDAASNVLQATRRQRYHNAPDTQLGELQNPTTTPKARVTYAAQYADALGRTVTSANYGTNGGTTLSRPNTTPTRSDTVLVTSQTYDDAGNMSSMTDPAGMIVCQEYDDRGRETARIMNCLASSSSSSSGSSSSGGCAPSDDINITVLTTYNADGNVASITAVNPFTGNQVTQYVYGTTLSDSELATSTLKRQEIYPDSVDSDDVIRFTYNRQQQVTTVTDQGGTVHAYDYDKLGRQTQDRVTDLGTGVDDAVRRISTTFKVRGMKATITSWDNPTVGSGNVLNQCQFEYNDFGQLVTEFQSHDGEVDVETTPSVGYTYADGSDNTIRPTGLVYPNGRELTYAYGTAEGIDDRASRVASIVDDDTTHLADYSYLGRQTFVEQNDTEPQLKWTLVNLAGTNDPDTGDIYSGLDRFGRVKDNRWYNYDAEEDVDRIQYGYDRAGNRIWRKNVVAESLGKKFDELYDYDAIHRLKDLDRGTLSALKDAINEPQFSECWSLDATGNWSGYKQSDDGSGWSLEQSRTSNDVNEITNISATTGPSWVSPAYSPAGNMTTMPQPNDPTQSYTATYDAWNRLVKIAAGANTVSEYVYDGAKRRIVQLSYEGGVLDETRHLYYTEPSQWQVIEERVGASPDTADAERQFVWGARYVDDLIVRERDSVASGTLDERYFACQDANWNTTAIGDQTGAIQERFAYSAFGLPLFLGPSFEPLSSTSAWNRLFAGYAYDSCCCLYAVRARTLHPALGVWMQRDPLKNTTGPNLYEYSGNMPLTLTDPTGMAASWCWADPWNCAACIGATTAFSLLATACVLCIAAVFIATPATLGAALLALSGCYATCCGAIAAFYAAAATCPGFPPMDSAVSAALTIACVLDVCYFSRTIFLRWAY